MTANLKASIKLANLKTGRPKGEPTRQVRYKWTIATAECLEKHREWLERNRGLIDEMAGGGT